MKNQKLKNRIRDRLRNQDGDSIAEVLIALLISSLALVMLASMITSSTKIITGSKTKMNDYYAACNSVTTYTVPTVEEGKSPNVVSDSTKKVSITFPDAAGKIDGLKPAEDGSGFSYPVDYYKNMVFPGKAVISFKKQ